MYYDLKKANKTGQNHITVRLLLLATEENNSDLGSGGAERKAEIFMFMISKQSITAKNIFG